MSILGRRWAEARFPLLLEARDTYLEELVQIGAEDRQELHPLEEPIRVVLGESEDASIELQPRELAVQETLGAGKGSSIGASMLAARAVGSPVGRTERAGLSGKGFG